MEQISQLRQMREEAIGRLQGNPDFKLINSLDALIRDLEEFSSGIFGGDVVEPIAESATISDLDDGVAAETVEADIATIEDLDPQDEIVQEISELSRSDPSAATDAIEALEAELTSATSNDKFEAETQREKSVADASGMLN